MTGSNAVRVATDVSADELDIFADYNGHAAPVTQANGLIATAHKAAPKSLAMVLLCGIYYVVVYIESRAFTARLHRLAGAAAWDVLNSIQADLIKNPIRGDLVSGLGGIRKARCPNPIRGKGKRGGFRYLFLYLEDRGHIHLLYLLDKDEQEDLTANERKSLRTLVTEIKRTRGGHQLP